MDTPTIRNTPLDASKDGKGPSFSLRNRLTRVVWMLTWLLLAKWTPPPLHRWRRLVLIAFGAKVGAGARVYGTTRVWLPANLELGREVLIGPRVNLYNQGRISIGDGSIVSQGAHVCASTHDVHDPNFQLLLRPIRIGRNCWVATEAFVGPGVAMHDRAVLGARGVLFGTAEEQGIYRGNPAMLIKHRRWPEAKRDVTSE